MEHMTLHDAWILIGEACYAYKNKKARHALMLISADIARKNIEIATKPLDLAVKDSDKSAKSLAV